MKKIIISLFVVVLIAVGYWLVSPFFINVEVSEPLPSEMINKSNGSNSIPSDMIVMQGQFVGFDKIHNGTGTASVYQFADADAEGHGRKRFFLRFEDGFQVNNGPDLYVGFGKNGQYVKGSEISKLKGNVGSQNYEISANVDLSQYDSVWVWCKAFSTPFVKADLKAVEQGTKVSPGITYKNATADLIQIELPFPGAVTGKDFSIIGKARGYWFFEASFPIEVLDKNGKVLATVIGQPRDGDSWMTENFVNFKADVKVPQSYIGPATIVIHKDDPSGMPENAASISFPITIEY